MAETGKITNRVSKGASTWLVALSLAGGLLAGFFAPTTGAVVPVALAQRGFGECYQCAGGSGDPDSGQGLLTCARTRRAAHAGCWLWKRGEMWVCQNYGTCTPSVVNPGF